MTAVKVVLERSTGEEVEFGPFSQGVVIEDGIVRNVATSKIIVRQLFTGVWMSCIGPRYFVSNRLYVQACS